MTESILAPKRGTIIKFSNKRAQERFPQMTNTAQSLAFEMVEWAKTKWDVDLVITETWTLAVEDHKLNRQSDTHRTGRAFDIRTRNLKDDFKSAFLEHFRFLYNDKLGAVVVDPDTKKAFSNLIVDKPHGSGPHWHVQVKRGSK